MTATAATPVDAPHRDLLDAANKLPRLIQEHRAAVLNPPLDGPAAVAEAKALADAIKALATRLPWDVYEQVMAALPRPDDVVSLAPGAAAGAVVLESDGYCD